MPREDNQDYEPWKFLVRGLSMGFASSGNRLNLALLSSFKPAFSANHSIHLEPYESGHGTGMIASYFRHFGTFIRPNLRVLFAGLIMSGEWRRKNDYWDSGVRASVGLIAGGSTYLSRVNPTSGTRWSVSTSLKLTAGEESHYALRFLADFAQVLPCLLYTSPSPRDKRQSRMPSSA